MSTTADTSSPNEINRDALEMELRAFCKNRMELNMSWDEAIAKGPEGGKSLWGDHQRVDSKTVTLTTDIFKKYLGIGLDITLVKLGGYDSIDEMVDDLIPKMIEKAHEE